MMSTKVSWQVKDFADRWIDVSSEIEAKTLSVEQSGAAIRRKPSSAASRKSAERQILINDVELKEAVEEALQVGELWGIQSRDPAPEYRRAMIERIIDRLMARCEVD